MKQSFPFELKAYCSHLTQLIKIPCTMFSPSSELIFSTFSSLMEEPDDYSMTTVVTGRLRSLLQLDTLPNVLIAEDQLLYGIVKENSSDMYLIIGPATTSPFDKERLHSFCNNNFVPARQLPYVQEFLLRLPLTATNYFYQLLIFVHYCLNGESLAIADHFSSQLDAMQITPEEFTKLSIESKEESIYHNGYYIEEEILNCIETGDSGRLSHLLTMAMPDTGNNQTSPALRQNKNDFISMVTLVTRSAIRGGMDMESAYQLSDLYIKKVEELRTVSEVQSSYKTMLEDYVQRVAGENVTYGLSKEMYACIQYVNQHTNEPITVEDVASHIHRSRSYTSTRFKKELGFNLNSYIMSRKLEEAKRLLTYTDMSLSTISAYLCFSSQAHFQNAFKKKYHLTPNQYRKENR